MIAWLIIGGGIHGTYLSHLLVNQVGLNRDEVRVLDPHQAPLATWNRNATNCGMRYLRSPATHNIDIPVLSLYRFARSPDVKEIADFIPPYNRPSLILFQKHCAHVIRHYRLEKLRIIGRALALHTHNPHSLTAETSVGSIAARNVILAMGLGEQPYWPSWARRLQQAGSRIDHVFDYGFRTADIPESTEGVIVVGGGLSAVQTALMLSKRLSGRVRLLSQHDLYESQYDFDPCWIGPKCLREFYRQDYGSRRATVDRARVGGSLPGEIFEEFRTALDTTDLHFQKSRIRSAVPDGNRIRLDTDTGTVWADTVVLATGFLTNRPGGDFIDQVIEEFGLPCGPCGFPIIGEDLRWAANIFVTGPLAELQLGPCARNIIGARNAGRHLLKVLGAQQ
ncbi:MAG: lysine N(6)-hydroxylase/L-ornithine N(5)-oxygenase family protein [Desulfobacterales bacterium]|nr:lysine N(6)-hydroxylase/L-ornithine N(5)-oxygenase family protein [Desulfobacterales bacterium]